MTDIHSHIIPFIDDGSKSAEESLKMLKEAINNGITDIIATPHYCPNRKYVSTVSEIKEAYNSFLDEVKKANLPTNLYLGEEIYYSDYDDIISKLDNGELLTLNNTKYVLIEFSPKKMPENLFELLYNLNLHGYKPIIAHIERYKWATLDIVTRIKDEGGFIQINAFSLSVIKTCRFCKKLIKNGLVDFIASDIHAGRKNCYKNFDVYADNALLDEIKRG